MQEIEEILLLGSGHQIDVAQKRLVHQFHVDFEQFAL